MDEEQTPVETNPGIQFLEKILEAHRASDREAMSMASVAAYVQNQQRMLHTGKRLDAQADAYLKAKFEACGHPDVFQSPSEEEDEAMGHTLINCTFNSEKSIEEISRALTKIGKDGKPIADKEKTKRPWWGRLLGTLAAVSLGAGITYGTAKYFQGEPSQYEAAALPYQPGYNPFQPQGEN